MGNKIQAYLRNERDLEGIERASELTGWTKSKLVCKAVNDYLNKNAPNRTDEELRRAFGLKLS